MAKRQKGTRKDKEPETITVMLRGEPVSVMRRLGPVPVENEIAAIRAIKSVDPATVEAMVKRITDEASKYPPGVARVYHEYTGGTCVDTLTYRMEVKP